MKYILLCDDDEGIADIVTIVLSEKGYKVKSVTESKYIFEVIESCIPDLILLDLWMPGLGGEAIVKQLKRDKSTQDIPIIIFSANKEANLIARELKVAGVLLKPFDIEELENIVEEHTK